MKNTLSPARASTKEQTEKGLSLPAQSKATKKCANSHGFRILEKLVDNGESAKTSKTPNKIPPNGKATWKEGEKIHHSQTLNLEQSILGI